jgi:OOP family OmpA-OmpF porin
MKAKAILAAVATALGLASVSAFADEDLYREAWYAVPGINYNWTDSDLKADDGMGGFIRFGKELTPNWDIQAGASYARTDEDSSLSTHGKYKQALFGVDALYMFSRDKFRPFLLAGLGYADNKTRYSNATWGGSKDSWMGNVGAGFQYLVSDKLGFQADLRHIWSEAETGLVGNRDTKTVGNTQLNLGVIYRFGEPAAKPAATPEPVAAAPAPAPVVAPAPAPAPEKPAAEPCKPTVEKMTLSAAELFAFNGDRLSNEGKSKLDETAQKIKQHADIELVMVDGYTDRIGSTAYNQKLSERRANAVKKYLIEQGVDANRVQAVGKGEADPVVACEGVRGKKKLIECLAPNRRVVVEATYKQESGCTQQ